MKTFLLTVSSPDGDLFNGDAVKISLRGVEGELAVMAGHIPFVTSLAKAPCVLWLGDGTKKTASVDGGVLSVDKDSVTLISGSFTFD